MTGKAALGALRDRDACHLSSSIGLFFPAEEVVERIVSAPSRPTYFFSHGHTEYPRDFGEAVQDPELLQGNYDQDNLRRE